MTFAENTAHIARFAPRNNPQSLSGRFTLAFGNGEMPKIAQGIQSTVLDTRQQALESLILLLSKPENVVLAVQEAVPQLLLQSISDEDIIVREHAVHALSKMAMSPIGSNALIDIRAPRAIAKLFTDLSISAREKAYLTLLHTTRRVFGSEAVLDAGLINVLVANARNEDPFLKPIVLEILYNVTKLEDGVVAALVGSNKIMETCIKLLSSAELDVRTYAAKIIMNLSFSADGKKEAVACGAIPELCKLLRLSDAALITAVCGALMSITIENEGKVMALDCNATPYLLQLLRHDDAGVLLNVIKTITSLAEIAAARDILVAAVEPLRALQTHSVLGVAGAAKRALRMLEKTP